jgi:hypothetical protein
LPVNLALQENKGIMVNSVNIIGIVGKTTLDEAQTYANKGIIFNPQGIVAFAGSVIKIEGKPVIRIQLVTMVNNLVIGKITFDFARLSDDSAASCNRMKNSAINHNPGFGCTLGQEVCSNLP